VGRPPCCACPHPSLRAEVPSDALAPLAISSPFGPALGPLPGALLSIAALCVCSPVMQRLFWSPFYTCAPPAADWRPPLARPLRKGPIAAHCWLAGRWFAPRGEKEASQRARVGWGLARALSVIQLFAHRPGVCGARENEIESVCDVCDTVVQTSAPASPLFEHQILPPRGQCELPAWSSAPPCTPPRRVTGPPLIAAREQNCPVGPHNSEEAQSGPLAVRRPRAGHTQATQMRPLPSVWLPFWPKSAEISARQFRQPDNSFHTCRPVGPTAPLGQHHPEGGGPLSAGQATPVSE